MTGYAGTRGVLRPARVGGVEVWVETVPQAGSEHTSGPAVKGRAAKAAEGVTEAFDHAQDAIKAIAGKLAATVSELGEQRIYPAQVGVEFGLSFSATGNVIVAGSTVEASLKVTLTYDRDRDTGTGAAGSAERQG